MKKILLLFAAFTFCTIYLHGQTTIFSTDFETYTVGGKLAQQAGSPWTTWSIAPGGAEDPAISSTQAHSGTKSVGVINNNDCVFQFQDKTHGRFITEWYMYVESTKLGYFNFLSDFAGSSSKWALQAFIKNDSITVDANGASKAKATFASNTWKKMQVITDLDDDFATLYIDGIEIISYQWSKGAQGTDNSLKLDGINFYGWNDDGAGTCGYYIDDLKVDSVAAPESPSNLDASLNGNDINIVWTAPTGTPDLYKLSRNGVVVYANNGLTYIDNDPWPNTYVYQARAHFPGLGYSHGSNKDSVTISGGVTRNLVLMEEFTGTWCGYCPGAAMGLRDLIETNHKNAAAIAYHNGDNYVNASATSRENYYNVSAFPTVVADGNRDGSSRVEGGSATQSMYTTYLPIYNKRIAMPSFHNLNVNVVATGGTNYEATITAQETFTAFSPVKLHVVLTESNIAQTWGNQTELDFVCRGMFPSATGSVINFATQNPQILTINFSTDTYVKNNCELVVFIQDDVSREVTQTAVVDMSTVIGVEELSGDKINIYPNPASEYFVAMTNGNATLEIFDISGKLIHSEALTQTSQNIDIQNINKGVYFVRISSDKNTFTKKLIVE